MDDSDDVGLFWTKTPTRKAKNKEPIGPVVLKPYVAPPPLEYELMARDEIVSGVGGVLFFDVECFNNFFMVAFKSAALGKYILFIAPFDEKQITQLAWVVKKYVCVGFNSARFDLPLITLACNGADRGMLKDCANALIAGARLRDVEQRFGFTTQVFENIDLIEVCPLYGSLKLYGARLHAKRIQDVPWAEEQALEEWQKEVTQDYCLNDLGLTELLYNNLQEQLALRRSMSDEYHCDLMSKSDAQIAEEVIGREITRLSGMRPGRPMIESGAVHRYRVPANLKFKTAAMKKVLEVVRTAEFRIDDGGRVVRPEEIKEMKIEIGSSVYRMGVGGLHSSEKSVGVIADAKHEIFDRDVSSYYPAIVVQGRLAPKGLGDDFLVVYKDLIRRRLEAKKRGDIAVSENLKVAVNGSFGKTGSPYSILYAPEVIIAITVGGQLYLLMLIEALEAVGVPVVSANTDGVVVRCSKRLRKKMLEVVARWEAATGFITEETQYRAVYSRDVNAYLAVKADGTVKGKNVYYDPWREGGSARELFWRFQKNPVCQICVEAVEKFLVSGVPIEDTVRGCSDIRRFVAVKNVKGGAHKDGSYLGKVVRWYYAIGAEGTINYITNNHTVGDTLGARPCMDLPEVFPEDVDYDWYVRKCGEMLKDIGHMPK